MAALAADLGVMQALAARDGHNGMSSRVTKLGVVEMPRDRDGRRRLYLCHALLEGDIT